MANSRHQLLDGLRALQAAEQGTLFKQARLNVAMCYPSPYHVGMSSLGFQTIYREVHAHPEATAERVFLPDDVEAWRAVKAMPASIETQRSLDQFDVLAFSVAGSCPPKSLHGKPATTRPVRRPRRRHHRSPPSGNTWRT